MDLNMGGGKKKRFGGVFKGCNKIIKWGSRLP